MDRVALAAAFCDELQKLAASKQQMRVPQTRKGRRSMHVATMLKKEKEGTLYKAATPIFDMVRQALEKPDASAAPQPKKKGDSPTVGAPATFTKTEPADPNRSILSFTGIW